MIDSPYIGQYKTIQFIKTISLSGRLMAAAPNQAFP